MSLHALMAVLGPETCKQLIRDADAEWEASEGICAEPYMGNVVAEDRPLECEGNPFADIPLPFDPYGCANPVSQEDSGE